MAQEIDPYPYVSDETPKHLVGRTPSEVYKPGIREKIMDWFGKLKLYTKIRKDHPRKNIQPPSLLRIPMVEAVHAEFNMPGHSLIMTSGKTQAAQDYKPEPSYSLENFKKDVIEVFDPYPLQSPYPDKQVFQYLENGVPSHIKKPAWDIVLSANSQLLLPYLEIIERQTAKEISKGFIVEFVPTLENPLPTLPYYNTPQGAVPKRLFGVEVADAARKTSDYTHNRGDKEDVTTPRNLQIDMSSLAICKLPTPAHMTEAIAILSTTGHEVFLGAADMTAAFNRVMLAGETLFQTGFSLSGGTCYYSKVLDFGCCYSPTIFSQIGNVIVLKIRKEMLRAEQDIVLEPDLKTSY